MARTKRSSSTSRSTTTSSSKQELYSGHYVPNRGGYLKVWSLEEDGENLVELAKEEDIVPDQEIFYMQDRWKSNKFYKTAFHHKVEWDTIVELVKAKMIYKKYGNKG
jgi:hypothetical protein